MHEEIIEKAGELIRQNTAHCTPVGSEPYCAMALYDLDGYPTVSSITPSRSDGIRQITFCTGLESNKANRIRQDSRASICFNAGGAYNITLVGTAEVVTDEVVKRDMWYEGLGNHFTGPDDPHYCVLRFTTERYNLLVDWVAAEGTL